MWKTLAPAVYKRVEDQMAAMTDDFCMKQYGVLPHKLYEETIEALESQHFRRLNGLKKLQDSALPNWIRMKMKGQHVETDPWQDKIFEDYMKWRENMDDPNDPANRYTTRCDACGGGNPHKWDDGKPVPLGRK